MQCLEVWEPSMKGRGDLWGDRTFTHISLGWVRVLELWVMGQIGFLSFFSFLGSVSIDHCCKVTKVEFL